MATFNIENFRSELSKSGTLQSNKFEVFFGSPKVMQRLNINGVSSSDTERLINLRAESAKIPGVGLLMSDVNRYGVGVMQKMPYSAAFTSTAITFIADGQNDIHKYFYTWMSLIFDSTGISTAASSNFNSIPLYKTEYKDNYVTDLHVRIYNVFGDQVQELVMYKAFPEAMNDVGLNWNDNNSLLKVGVSFSFRDWAMLNLDNTTNGTTTTTVTTSAAPQFDALGSVTIPGFSATTTTTTPNGSVNSNQLPLPQQP